MLDNYMELTEKEKIKRLELELRYMRENAQATIDSLREEIRLLREEAKHWQERTKELENRINTTLHRKWQK